MTLTDLFRPCGRLSIVTSSEAATGVEHGAQLRHRTGEAFDAATNLALAGCDFLRAPPFSVRGSRITVFRNGHYIQNCYTRLGQSMRHSQ